jgi:hypothetical protein
MASSVQQPETGVSPDKPGRLERMSCADGSGRASYQADVEPRQRPWAATGSAGPPPQAGDQAGLEELQAVEEPVGLGRPRWPPSPACPSRSIEAGTASGSGTLMPGTLARSIRATTRSACCSARCLTTCLHSQAAPLLHGTYSDTVSRQLFAVAAELSRLAGLTAFDTGRHDLAQRC